MRKPFKWSLTLKTIRTNQHPASGLKTRNKLITLTGGTYYNTTKNCRLYNWQQFNPTFL